MQCTLVSFQITPEALWLTTRFSYIRKKFYKKMSIKNSKTLENVKKNFQAQMPELQFLKMLIFHRALFKSQN